MIYNLYVSGQNGDVKSDALCIESATLLAR